jgi:hypothetical protein
MNIGWPAAAFSKCPSRTLPFGLLPSRDERVQQDTGFSHSSAAPPSLEPQVSPPALSKQFVLALGRLTKLTRPHAEHDHYRLAFGLANQKVQRRTGLHRQLDAGRPLPE